MEGLPADLYKDLHHTLLKCSEFDSHSALQAVFVTSDLAPYHDGIPVATSKAERVSSMIDYLLRLQSSDGRPVLLHFLDALCAHRQDGDALLADLKRLCSEIEQVSNPNNEIEVPFVIVAMNRSEANELISGALLNNSEVSEAARTRFQQLRDAIQAHGILDLPSYYDELRDNWRPYIQGQSTIREIILDVVGSSNQKRREIPLPLIHPKFFSKEFFAIEADVHLNTWHQLNQREGCILIADAVSLFHPILHEAVLQSGLSSDKQVAMAILILSCVDSASSQANDVIKQEVGLRMQRAFARFAKYDDPMCHIHIGDVIDLRRWLLHNVLPRMADSIPAQRANPDNLEIIHNEMGPSRGFDSVISGQ